MNQDKKGMKKNITNKEWKKFFYTIKPWIASVLCLILIIQIILSTIIPIEAVASSEILIGKNIYLKQENFGINKEIESNIQKVESTSVEEEESSTKEQESTSVKEEENSTKEVESTSVKEEESSTKEVESTSVEEEESSTKEVESTSVKEEESSTKEVESTSVREEESSIQEILLFQSLENSQKQVEIIPSIEKDGVNEGNTIKYTMQYTVKFWNDELTDTYTILYPANLKLSGVDDSNPIENIIKTETNQAVGTIKRYSNKMVIDFSTHKETDGTLTVNKPNRDNTGREYLDILVSMKGMLMIFTPLNNTGKETVEYTYEVSDGTMLDPTSQELTYPKFVKHISIEKKMEKEGNLYKCTTIIKPGNVEEERVNKLQISELLEDYEVDTTKEIKFQEAILSEADYNITKTDIGSYHKQQKLGYIVENFDMESNLYQEDDELVFTYYVKINPEIYKDTQDTVLKNTTVLYQEDNGREIKKSNPLKETISPKPATYQYELVQEGGKITGLKWTVEVNGNEVDMHYPNLGIEIAEEDKAYLEIKADSIELDGSTVSSDKITITTTSLTSTNLGTGIGVECNPIKCTNRKHTITFVTTIKDEFWKTNRSKTFDITVNLKWKNTHNASEDGNEISGKWNGGTKKPVSSSNIKKTVAEINPSKGTITWQIEVNSNRQVIKNVKITDTIVTGSNLKVISILDATSGTDTSLWSESTGTASISVSQATESSAGKVIINGPASTDEKLIYKIITKVPDKVKYGNAIVSYKNYVSMEAEDGITGNANISKNYESKLLSKEGNYKKTEHTVEWKITINTSKTPLTNAILKDRMTEGENYDVLHYKKDSVKVMKGSENITGSCSITEPNYENADIEDDWLIIEFPEHIEEQCVVTYTTEVNNNHIYHTSGSVSISNNAILTSDEINTIGQPVKKSAAENIDIAVITKERIKANANYTEWKITVNDDYQNLRGGDTPYIYDTYMADTEGIKFSIDPSDMILMAIDKTGTEQTIPVVLKGTETEGNKEASIELSSLDNSFKLYLPIEVDDFCASAKYTLQYRLRTEVPSAIKSFSVKNMAKFYGTRGNAVPPQETKWISSGKIQISSVDSWGTEYKTLTVTKKDIDTDKFLQGAKFELWNSYGCVQSGTTDENGKIEFEGLKKTIVYTLKEVKPPKGYLLPENPEQNIALTQTAITIKDKRAEADFSFTKKGKNYDGTTQVIEGAEFELLDAAGQELSPKIIVSSDTEGKVLFQNIPFGDYIIKEINAPEGYELSATEVSVKMLQDEVDFAKITVEMSQNIGDFTEGIFVNKLKTGNIIIKARKEGNNTSHIFPANAKLTLYKKKEKIVSIETNGTNEAVFQNIPYGNYSIRMESDIEGYDFEFENILLGDLVTGAMNTTEIELVVPYNTATSKVETQIFSAEDEKIKLEGAEVALYRLDEVSNEWILYRRNLVNADGKVRWSVRKGNYKIVQKSTLDGYILDTKEYKLEVKENEVHTVDIENKVEESTTEAPTSEEVTSEEATSEAPTSEESTSEEPTSEESTSEEATSEEPTSEEATSEEATSEEPTTEAPTTEEETTTAKKTHHREDNDDNIIIETQIESIQINAIKETKNDVEEIETESETIELEANGKDEDVKTEANDNGIAPDINNQRGKLPQSGSFWDFSTIIFCGILCIGIGILYETKFKKNKSSDKTKNR